MTEFAVGFLSNMASTVMTHPLDVIKTRVQTRGIGMVAAARSIYRVDGLRNFAAGIGPSLLTYPIFWAGFFGTRRWMDQWMDQCSQHSMLTSYTTAYIASVVASTVANPLYVIKTRQQTSPDTPCSAVVRQLNRSGPLAYFRGLPATSIANLKTAAAFPLTEALQKHGVTNTIGAAGLAKLACNSIVYPLDMARVIQRASVDTKPLRMVDIFAHAYRQNGPSGLFRGFVAYNAVSVPNFAVMMGMAEWLRKINLGQ